MISAQEILNRYRKNNKTAIGMPIILMNNRKVMNGNKMKYISPYAKLFVGA